MASGPGDLCYSGVFECSLPEVGEPRLDDFRWLWEEESRLRETAVAERDALERRLEDAEENERKCQIEIERLHWQLDAERQARSDDALRHSEGVARVKREFDARYRKFEEDCLSARRQANCEYERVGKGLRKCKDSICAAESRARASADARVADVLASAKTTCDRVVADAKAQLRDLRIADQQAMRDAEEKREAELADERAKHRG